MCLKKQKRCFAIEERRATVTAFRKYLFVFRAVIPAHGVYSLEYRRVLVFILVFVLFVTVLSSSS